MSENSNHWLKIFPKPHTQLGYYALWLALASFILNFMWMILPGGALASFLTGIAAGVCAIIAIRRDGERSWLVYLCILPLLGVIAFLLGEFLVPH